MTKPRNYCMHIILAFSLLSFSCNICMYALLSNLQSFLDTKGHSHKSHHENTHHDCTMTQIFFKHFIALLLRLK